VGARAVAAAALERPARSVAARTEVARSLAAALAVALSFRCLAQPTILLMMAQRHADSSI
jgi:hypothetical protein